MSEPTVFEIHSHSTVSDGRFAPDKMARLMAEKGVELWALTDHDNIDGCERAREAAAREGVAFVCGIEISAQVDGSSIHVLGYGFDPGATDLASYGARMVQARQDRMVKMVERMCELGFEITLEEVLAGSEEGNVGRPHMALALVKRGYVDNAQAAFDRWLARNQPGYVPMTLLSVDETIEMITAAGGMVVLAHPARYGEITEHLERWKGLGLWGLEVRHPSHDSEEEARLIRVAEQFGLGMTASNDWHGTHPKAMDQLGRVRFPEEWRRPFLARLKETSSKISAG